MIKIICKALILNIGLFFTGAANATTLTHLYEVSVPVFSQSSAERRSATEKAFEELLIRITGKTDVSGLEFGHKLLGESRRFVRSFRYEILPAEVKFNNESERESQAPENNQRASEAEEDEKPVATQKIVVSFDEEAVKNSLWKYKLPVWGKTRPSTLFWVAIEDNGQRKMLNASEPTELLALIKQHAEKRGVPLKFPGLDLEDQLKINVTDVWGSYKETINNASLRYQPEAIIAARLFLDQAGVWQTRWNLYQGGDENSWQLSGPHLNVVIYESLDKLAAILADRYAQVSSGDDENKFLIRISDVANLADYEKINRYLNAISVIKRAELWQIQSNELVYELELRSTPGALKQAIDLGKTLSAQDDPFAAEVDVNRLNYRLVP